MMKLLAAIVVPPHMSISGGARAAELLSASLADHCDITVASMMNGEGLSATAGGSLPARIAVRSWLPPLVPWSKFSNRYSTLFYRSDLPAIIRKGRFDLVHIHNPMPALEMERVARACTAGRVPYVVSTHGFNEVANGGQVYGFGGLKRLAWKTLVAAPVGRVVARANGIFALSPADFEIVRRMGFAGSELSVVTNGVPIPDLAPRVGDAEILGRLGILADKAPGQITCMFLGNHTPNKGLPILLEAFAGLDRPYLLIVGGEKRPDIDYDGYLGGRRPDQRIVITGRLSDDDIRAALPRRIFSSSRRLPTPSCWSSSKPWRMACRCWPRASAAYRISSPRIAAFWWSPATWLVCARPSPRSPNSRSALPPWGATPGCARLGSSPGTKPANDAVKAYQRVLERQSVTRSDRIVPVRGRTGQQQVIRKGY
jgi:glycosyltransferase involved in cell wall biosynthesis